MATQGGHKPGKHEKPGKLREFEKLSKCQGKLREIRTFLEKPVKLMENEQHVTLSPTKMHSIEFFSLELLREKVKKYPGNLRENSVNSVS